MQKIILIILSIIIITICGCEKAPAPKALVEITGSSDTSVSYNGKKLGTLPLKLKLPPNNYVFKFEANNHKTTWKTINAKINAKNNLDVKLQPNFTTVLITSSPSGAQLNMNNKVIGTTPILLKNQREGQYKGQLHINGYTPKNISWHVHNNRPVKVDKNLISNSSKVYISSNPTNAQVIIDKRIIGTTPLEYELKNGKYQITLHKQNYSPSEQTIAITNGKARRYNFKLIPIPGGLEITTNPTEAEVFLNGNKVAVTPCKLKDISIGNYNLEIRKKNYDPIIKNIRISAGFIDKYNFNLNSGTASAVLNVFPAGVRVLLNGKYIGVSEAIKDSKYNTKPIAVNNLPPGNYTLTLTHPQAVPSHKTIKFTLNKGEQFNSPQLHLWVANCEITYLDGRVERGVISYENDKFIMFSPMPGVKGQINRDKFKSIKKFNVTNEK